MGKTAFYTDADMIPITAYLPKAVENILPPVFYFMQFSSWTWQNCTELDNTAEGTVTFQCSLHLCQQSSTTFEQELYSHPVQVALPLQPLVHGILLCLITGVKVLSWAFFSKEQTGDNLMVWVQDCREDAGGNIMVAGFLDVERVLVHTCLRWQQWTPATTLKHQDFW